ncbi:hypothetical protein E7T06_11375 [Deinococcus sp. Arct2-2]|uniref:recombinase family protein n=1 Tax=Deinococcus sp. Arct2-2 TaxID=2568653 RepID=UPI0010A52A13|nr:recombinase family protein [Deinococcus sp. Arct2-2]THF69608.1 hypothetical protein E7T06_11375 [Deinococcus sp. Arct2-2]
MTIQDQHLRRAAVVYVRQSSPIQVRDNIGSTMHQRSLYDTARQLGWREDQIIVIEDDLGVSASFGSVRPGLEKILRMIEADEVGIIFSSQITRLFRNGVDGERVIEYSEVMNVLLGDHNRIYDPNNISDRMLLGINKIFAKQDSSMLHERSFSAKKALASIGEFKIKCPTGYVRIGALIVKDPDKSVRDAIDKIFRLFREEGSATGVTRRLAIEVAESGGVTGYIPTRLPTGVEWVIPYRSRVFNILKNPTYAGANSFGRLTIKKRIKDGRVYKSVKKNVRQDWFSLHMKKHEGYITWEEFLTNQEKILGNTYNFGGYSAGSPRTGNNLLQGLVICGGCGKHLYTRKLSVSRSLYQCRHSETSRYTNCKDLYVNGLNDIIFNEIRQQLTILNVEAVENFEDVLLLEKSKARITRDDSIKGAKNRVTKAEKAYRYAVENIEDGEVSSEIVKNLLKEWEASIKTLRSVENSEDFETAKDPENFTQEERSYLKNILNDLDFIRTSDFISNKDRKELIRCFISRVTITKSDDHKIEIVWSSGRNTVIHMPLTQLKYEKSFIDSLRKLSLTMTNKEIIEKFNSEGVKPLRGRTFTRLLLKSIKRRYKIPSLPR